MQKELFSLGDVSVCNRDDVAVVKIKGEEVSLSSLVSAVAFAMFANGVEEADIKLSKELQFEIKVTAK